jgi:hypothetical protein
MNQASNIRRFVGLVFVLLLPCFGLWVLLDTALVQPLVGLLHLLFTHWLPDMVAAVQFDGSNAMVVTRYGDLDGKLVSATAAGHNVAIPVNTRLLTYALPFYSALYLAGGAQRGWAGYISGFLVLCALILVGLAWVCLKELMVMLGPLFTAEDTVLPPASVIALCYQFSVLVLPALSPVALWAWQYRDQPLLRQISAARPPAP